MVPSRQACITIDEQLIDWSLVFINDLLGVKCVGLTRNVKYTHLNDAPDASRVIVNLSNIIGNK